GVGGADHIDMRHLSSPHPASARGPPRHGGHIRAGEQPLQCILRYAYHIGMGVSKMRDRGDTAPVRGARERTRRLMLDTATRMMQQGQTPSVSGVAEAAGVSRATAYRCFASQAALVSAV